MAAMAVYIIYFIVNFSLYIAELQCHAEEPGVVLTDDILPLKYLVMMS